MLLLDMIRDISAAKTTGGKKADENECHHVNLVAHGTSDSSRRAV